MSRLWGFPSLLFLFYLFALSSCRIAERVNTGGRIGARQDFHEKLVGLEALALKRAPWNINAIDENNIFGVGKTNDTTYGLKRRAGTPEPGQGDMVLSLWKNTQVKVPVNNKFTKFDITPDITRVMTTGTCYGCTAVVMCSATGKICIFAHFRQSNKESDTWAKGDKQDADFGENVIDPIEGAIIEYEEQLGKNPFCVVFTPATASNSFYYPWRIKGPDTITESITQACPMATILNIGYNYAGAKGDWSDDRAWGKLVLEWKGSASSCAGPSSILNVFAEENWWRSLRFDDNGNPVADDKTPCQSQHGSEDGFNEGP